MAKLQELNSKSQALTVAIIMVVQRNSCSGESQIGVGPQGKTANLESNFRVNFGFMHKCVV